MVISPDEMNEKIATVLIAPMTTKSHPYPSRVALRFAQKDAWVVLDQIRCIDKARLVGRLGKPGVAISSVSRLSSGRCWWIDVFGCMYSHSPTRLRLFNKTHALTQVIA